MAGEVTKLAAPAGPVEAAAKVVAAFAARRRLRAGAFIVTLYGDAVVPRGGLVWLGNVIEACGQVGISETLVRTAVSRLVTGGHLLGLRAGRRSYYRLTPQSHAAFQAAAERIYGSDDLPAEEGWTLLALPEGVADEPARRALATEGFGLIAPGLAARPGLPPVLPEPLAGLGAIPFAGSLQQVGLPALQERAQEAWGLADLNRGYRAFLALFQPLAACLKDGDGLGALDPALALSARLLLVHEFRRSLLQDPRLPTALLPADWAGQRARRLFARLYLDLTPGAETALEAGFVDAKGHLRLDRKAFKRRLSALELALASA
ncbi:MAG: phenylacetic acid degradation operon negative regulatory protein PaaX [Rhodospirillales bacterium]